MIQQAKLVDNEETYQQFIPFEEQNIEIAYFKTKIEAKLAIAKFLGKPLATIPEAQRKALDNLVAESLHKVTLLNKVKEFFKLRLVANQT